MICRYKIKFISDIEQKIRKLLVNIAVAPFVGVWIEIVRQLHPNVAVESLPSWECGLKFDDPGPDFEECLVAPFVGVWIEMYHPSNPFDPSSVAPFVGVWIEIVFIGLYKIVHCCRSLRGSVD